MINPTNPIPGGECRRAVSSAMRVLVARLAARRTAIAWLALICIVCGGAIRIGPTILQRFSWSMLQARTLAPGELAYIINADGTASLRLGDGVATAGLPLVDPASVRVSAQHLLDPLSDYYVDPSGGVTVNPDNSYTFTPAAIAATGTLRIVSQDSRKLISRVTFDAIVINDSLLPKTSHVRSYPSNVNLVNAATNIVTIIATDSNGGAETQIISNLAVYAWVDRSAIGSTNDYTQTTVLTKSAVNTASPTTLGQMQHWLANNEGKHWSLWPAMHNIALAGHSILFGGLKSWNMGPDSTGDLRFTRDGLSVVTISGGTTTNAADAVAIIKCNFTNSVYFDVYVWTRSVPTSAPVIASITNFATDAWMPYTAFSNSYPTTVSVNGTNTYLIRLSSPDSSRFFKAFAALPGDTAPSVDVASLKIAGTSFVPSAYLPIYTVVTGKVVSVQSGSRYFFTTATNVTLSVSLASGELVDYALLRNTATNAILAIGKTGWKWTGGAMTNSIGAGLGMTFQFSVNPITGATNAYATAASIN
jgi:hypothetical protein